MQLLITFEVPNMKIAENDNAVQLKGKTENGWQDKSFMKEDPELGSKLNAMIDAMESYQRGKLEGFTGPESPALDIFDSKIQLIRDKAQTIIEEQQEV